MNNSAKYPLKQIIEVKQRRVEDAEKVVKEKQSILDKEKEKLAQKEAERDKVKKHKIEKLTQLRAELDQTTTSPKVQQMKYYLKTVDEKLAMEDKKVKEQEQVVETAQKNLNLAKDDLRAKRQEVDKLLVHKKDWEKEMRREEEIKEGREQDELGTVIYMSRHAKGQDVKIV